MRVSIDLVSGSYEGIFTSKNLYRILHDYEWTTDHLPRSLSSQFSLTDKQGFPEMVQTLTDSFNPLNPEWQRYFYSLFKLFSRGAFSETTLKAKWASYMWSGRAFTNNFGSDRYRDVINKTHLDMPYMKMEELACGGNVVEYLGDEIVRANKYGEKVPWLKVRTLDINNKPPTLEQYTRQSHPELIHIATNASIIKLPDGTWRVDPFPQLGGLDTPYPFQSRGGYTYIEKKKLIKLDNSIIPLPYNR
jgi:hypothetical protein